MNIEDSLVSVRRLSDDELLAGLCGALGTSRRLVALVLTHLAEVEERRLHSLAGYSSLFAYCTLRLAMSEDEAYRRIRVARLARRLPSILELLTSGKVSLSVAALLEPCLNETNHRALLEAVSGKTVAQAREVLASWFPRPDVLPFIRKLPAKPASVSSAGADPPSESSPRIHGTDSHREVEAASSAAPSTAAPSSAAANSALEPLEACIENRAYPRTLPHPSRPSSRIEPLAPGRYKVQLTADAELKRKLDLARDLLRHAVPSGDLATLLGRALDLLIEQTLRRRFGKAHRPKAAAATPEPPAPSDVTAEPAPDAATPSERADAPPASTPAAARAPSAPDARAASTPTEPTSASTPPHAPVASTPNEPAPPCRSHHLPNAVRRTVLERDGLRCTWQAADGTRCESRAWLEHDHIDPRGQGGSDNPENIRVRCRSHNRLRAEQTYGQAKIDRIIARRRRAAEHCDEPTMMIDSVHVEDRSGPRLR